ncbi:MAG: glycosyltransferase family 4 protein [Acidobacteria bacterium]|nr:glycosyltransferase family 4 protein [Acidobacteriota bacterium]MCI0721154.1 glycosyltransferase family 4 protein [Acidobacteriota bacterium]
MNCLLLSRYGRLGASSRMRFYQYLPFLRSQDIHVETAALLDDSYIRNLNSGNSTDWCAILGSYLKRLRYLARSNQFDLVWVEAEVFPWLPGWGELWLSWKRIPYVVDYDDAAFHRYDLHPVTAVRWLLGQKIDQVMKHAALVVAGNSYLANRARQAGSGRIEILPTVVDLKRYAPQHSRRDNDFVIGWIGSQSTTRYLLPLLEVLRQATSWEGTSLRLVGSGKLNLPGVAADVMDWSESSEVQAIQSFTAGIMPLQDDPWARGKCGYKLIQYMACGLPVVASPVGVNGEIVEHWVNGFLADTEAEWLAALSELRSQPQLCEEFGRAGRKKVENTYSLEVTAPWLAELLKSAVK